MNQRLIKSLFCLGLLCSLISANMRPLIAEMSQKVPLPLPIGRENLVKTLLGDVDAVSPQTILLSQDILNTLQKEWPWFKSHFYKIYVGSKNRKAQAYVILDQVIGKSQPFDFAIILDPALKIRQIEILAYRETHGGEIKTPSFRDQFIGKNAAAALKLGDDIKNIAGATLSCRALTDSVRRHVRTMELIKHKLTVAQTNKPKTILKRSFFVMGTLLDISLVTAFQAPSHPFRDEHTMTADAHAEQTISRAFTLVQSLDNIFSTYKKNSEVSRLNRQSKNVPFNVSPEMLALLQSASDFYGATNGGFDITLGRITERWQIAESNQKTPPYDSPKIHHLQKPLKPDIYFSSPSPPYLLKGNILVKKSSAFSFDFGGIAKGYALDQIRSLLINEGYHSFLLNFGGQILAQGNEPQKNGQAIFDYFENKGWEVQLVDPYDRRQILKSLTLINQSLSVSANDQRGYVIHDRTYSHIISPLTKAPAGGKSLVAIIHESATAADALSTGLFALPWSDALHIAQKFDLALFMTSDNAPFKTYQSFQWPTLTQPMRTFSSYAGI